MAERVASDDDVRATQIGRRVSKYRGDVAQWIALAQKLRREFERNATQYPRARRATELLRIIDDDPPMKSP